VYSIDAKYFLNIFVLLFKYCDEYQIYDESSDDLRRITHQQPMDCIIICIAIIFVYYKNCFVFIHSTCFAKYGCHDMFLKSERTNEKPSRKRKMTLKGFFLNKAVCFREIGSSSPRLTSEYW